MNCLTSITLNLLILSAIIFVSGQKVKIIGGDEVEPHSLPYVVAIKTTINYKDIICGGSLVSESAVLTAARCVSGASEVELILGAHNISAPEDGQVRLTSSNFIIHEEYNITQNDIALVILPEKVQLSDNIALVTLPTNSDQDFTDHLGLVAGWGRINDTVTYYSDVLRKVEVVIISTITCEISYIFTLDFAHVCTTGTGGKNICKGDAGAPLISDGVQAGIASIGSDFGCISDFPAVYTRVTSFIDWINENLPQ